MFSDLSAILSGEKTAPEIPFKIEFDTTSVLKFAGILLIAAILFTLTLKVINK